MRYKETNPNDVINAYVNSDGNTYGGLTKREWFAGMVLVNLSDKMSPFEAAVNSINIADRIIEHLNKEVKEIQNPC